jgi:hypothetical protein
MAMASGVLRIDPPGVTNHDHRYRRMLDAMLAGRAQEHPSERAEPTTADHEQAGPHRQNSVIRFSLVSQDVHE